MKIQFYFFALMLLFHQNILSQDTHVKHVGEHAHLSTTKQSLVENKGQWPEGVIFQSSIDGGKVWVQQNKMVYHLQDFSSMHDNHTQFGAQTLNTEIREELVH